MKGYRCDSCGKFEHANSSQRDEEYHPNGWADMTGGRHMCAECQDMVLKFSDSNTTEDTKPSDIPEPGCPFSLDHIQLNSVEECDRVVLAMEGIIAKHGYVTVGDYFDLVGVVKDVRFPVDLWGWRSIASYSIFSGGRSGKYALRFDDPIRVS